MPLGRGDQTLTDIEIICVDVGSSNGMLEILKSFEERDSRILYE